MKTRDEETLAFGYSITTCFTDLLGDTKAAKNLLDYFDGDLRRIVTAGIEELTQVKGIGKAKAAIIKAAFELGRRATIRLNNHRITCPEDLLNLASVDEMKFLEEEHFKVILLNGRNRLIKTYTVSIGSVNASVVHPREVFKEAIRSSATGIIIIHNHPSGELEPSRDDIELTKQLLEAGKIIQIEVLDHIIVGDGYVSMKERGLFNDKR